MTRRKTDRPSSVLFVCSQNALRSPMAEAMVKAWYGDSVYVDSVGVEPADLNPFARTVMEEIGIDISGHRAKGLDGRRDAAYELIVALSPEAYEEASEIARTAAVEVVHWPIFDPTRVEGNRETQLAAFRELRDTLAALIEDLLGPADSAGAGPEQEG